MSKTIHNDQAFAIGLMFTTLSFIPSMYESRRVYKLSIINIKGIFFSASVGTLIYETIEGRLHEMHFQTKTCDHYTIVHEIPQICSKSTPY